MTKEQRQVCAYAFEFAREEDEPVLVAMLENTDLLEYKCAIDWVGYPYHEAYRPIMMIMPNGHIYFYDEDFVP